MHLWKRLVPNDINIVTSVNRNVLWQFEYIITINETYWAPYDVHGLKALDKSLKNYRQNIIKTRVYTWTIYTNISLYMSQYNMLLYERLNILISWHKKVIQNAYMIETWWWKKKKNETKQNKNKTKLGFYCSKNPNLSHDLKIKMNIDKWINRYTEEETK